jgi:hypothetical protein
MDWRRFSFYSITDSKIPHEDYYGYQWKEKQIIGNIIFRTGSMEENGGWFQNLHIEYLDNQQKWVKLNNRLAITPKFDKSNLALNKAHFLNYRIQFNPIETKGIRIVGLAGGGAPS